MREAACSVLCTGSPLTARSWPFPTATAPDTRSPKAFFRFERDRAFAAAAAAVAEPHTQFVLLRRFVNAHSPDASLVRLGGFGAAAA